MSRRCALASVLMLCLAGAVQAATVTFDLQPVAAATNNTVVVAPGAQVEYILTAQVVSDTATADNRGLALFQLEIQTNSGVTQPALTQFSTVVQQNFPSFQSLGIPEADKITSILGSQNLLANAPFVGFGVGSPQEIGRGVFNTPTTETSFTVTVGGDASVIGPTDQNKGPISATSKSGPGFTIQTSTSASGGGGGGGGGGSGSNSTVSPAAMSLAIFFGALMALVGMYMLGGNWGLITGLIIVPLIGLLLLAGL
jgi:hypothetical protein